MGGGLGLDACVGGRDREAAGAHDGQVDYIVADVCELVHGDAGFGGDLLGGGEFVGLALIDELEFEVAGADGDSGGLAFGNNADAQAAEAGEGDAEAIVGSEAFEFEAVLFAFGVGLGKEEELAVG